MCSRPSVIGLSLLTMALGGCMATGGLQNAGGTGATEIQAGARGPVSGVGIEGRDIIAMTDQMARDMLADPVLAGQRTPPRIIIDSGYFINDSAQVLNKNAITDRLRVYLNRAARGRLMFLARENVAMVERERDLKRQGITDVGTVGQTRAVAGADFRLTGRITSVDARSGRTGQIQRYNQVTFEMVDLESSALVWSGIYEFERAAGDDVVYR